MSVNPRLDGLPRELLVRIAYFCSHVRDILNLSSTCRALRPVLADESTFRPRLWDVPPSDAIFLPDGERAFMMLDGFQGAVEARLKGLGGPARRSRRRGLAERANAELSRLLAPLVSWQSPTIAERIAFHPDLAPAFDRLLPVMRDLSLRLGPTEQALNAAGCIDRLASVSSDKLEEGRLAQSCLVICLLTGRRCPYPAAPIWPVVDGGRRGILCRLDASAIGVEGMRLAYQLAFAVAFELLSLGSLAPNPAFIWPTPATRGRRPTIDLSGRDSANHPPILPTELSSTMSCHGIYRQDWLLALDPQMNIRLTVGDPSADGICALSGIGIDGVDKFTLQGQIRLEDRVVTAVKSYPHHEWGWSGFWIGDGLGMVGAWGTGAGGRVTPHGSWWVWPCPVVEGSGGVCMACASLPS